MKQDQVIKRLCLYLPGANMRNSVCGKGHEEGGSAYAKVGSSLRSPPGNSQEETPETPPSSRAEGLLFLHGLESNPGSSLQTEEEAGLP